MRVNYGMYWGVVGFLDDQDSKTAQSKTFIFILERSKAVTCKCYENDENLLLTFDSE